VLLVDVEQQVAERRAAEEAFDARARHVAAVLADMRVAQQVYLADGQDVGAWGSRVEALARGALGGIDGLTRATSSPVTRASLAQTSAEIKTFGAVDRRVREHLAHDETVVAGNLVLVEGGRAAVEASKLLDRARLEERNAAVAAVISLEQQRTYALAASAAVGILAIGLLVFAPVPRDDESSLNTTSIVDQSPPIAREMRSEPPREAVPDDFEPLLEGAAEICTAFGAAQERSQLASALARAADLMEARGLIVWIGDAEREALRPVIAHGYADHTLARMAVIPRTADNAAAAAYRTGELQIARARHDGTPGAVVAPMLAPDGCIGALTAEVKAGSELSLPLQALARLCAAQLTAVFALPPAASEPARDHAASA
jgi:hypothetical protein